jgi:very-short-patch-repair endonuclease
VALADPRAESPPETRLRLLLVDAGLPSPEVQYEVVDGHGFVLARCDLAHPPARVAIEYDDSVHLTRRQRERDLQRDAELSALGWLTVRFRAVDLEMAQTACCVRTILDTRRRAA